MRIEAGIDSDCHGSETLYPAVDRKSESFKVAVKKRYWSYCSPKLRH